MQGVLEALQPLTEALLHAKSGVILDLGATTSLTMPTLSGCLLGFPVVYLIGSQECGRIAASILSLEGQMLYKITSPNTVSRLQAGCCMPEAGLLLCFRECPHTQQACLWLKAALQDFAVLCTPLARDSAVGSSRGSNLHGSPGLHSIQLNNCMASCQQAICAPWTAAAAEASCCMVSHPSFVSFGLHEPEQHGMHRSNAVPCYGEVAAFHARGLLESTKKAGG